MIYQVTLADGSVRVFEYQPEVGVAGELVCRIDMEVVDGLSTSVGIEDVTFAPGSWYSVEPIAKKKEER